MHACTKRVICPPKRLKVAAASKHIFGQKHAHFSSIFLIQKEKKRLSTSTKEIESNKEEEEKSNLKGLKHFFHLLGIGID